MASGALDVLGQAKVVNTLDEAIADCHLIVGTSARSRTIPWPMLSPREFAEKAMRESSRNIAILFGREQSGLTNEELHRCHFHIQIPSDPDYSSLNLAQAVQVISYELRVAAQIDPPQTASDYPFASEGDMSKFYTHLEQVLIALDFFKTRSASPSIDDAHYVRLFNRTRPGCHGNEHFAWYFGEYRKE